MAQAQIGNRIGFVDKRAVQNTGTSAADTNANNPTKYNSRTAMVNALLDATYGAPATYTNLHSHMTSNDLVYAVRLLYDSAGIK